MSADIGPNKTTRPPGGASPSLAFLAILLLAAFLRLYHLGQVGRNGFGNLYYSAAVQSMLASWRNFFYLSLDPAGFISLEKPPFAFWVQAAIARLFGFHGLSLMLPGALAGILSVFILYHLVRRAFGEWPGLLAALCLAITPISVVIDRSNHPDPLLTLTVLAGAYTLTRAVEEDSPRWLLATAALVGVGFNIKMLQLILVAPAFFLLYLYAYPANWRKKLAHGALALLTTLLFSLTWMIAVELTPPDQRPYIGGSVDNTLIDLVFGYNGLARLWSENWNELLGPPGPLRFFGPQLAGQISWMLPFALANLPLAIWQNYRGVHSGSHVTRRRNAILLWSSWLFFQLLYFSVSTFYHRYYLAMLAPAVAALVGIGVHALRRAWLASGWGKAWSILTIALTAGLQIYFLLPYPSWGRWLIPPVAIVCLITCGITLMSWRPQGESFHMWSRAAIAGGILTLLVAPTVWVAIPVFTCMDANITLPTGGPQKESCKPFRVEPFLDPSLVAYLQDNRQGARFLAATFDMGVAHLGILESSEAFMALGGYRGSDPVLTVNGFAQYVSEGQVRFFVAMSEVAEFPQQEPILTWVQEHCPPAPIESKGVVVLGPCSVAKVSKRFLHFPTRGWRTATPESQGMDSERLADMFQQIRDQRPAIDSVTIIRNGYLVADTHIHPFQPGERHIIHSCTKSIVSILIGIAIEQGYIDRVDQPVLEILPARSITNADTWKESMTLEHLLTMTSGLECRDSYLYRWRGMRQMRASADWVQFMLDLPMAEAPGTRFEYCNGASFLLSAILQETTGASALEFAQENLFGPLGISDVEWPANPQGINIGWGEMHMRPHDMAKIGYLNLNEGVWDGRQIIPAAWVEASTRKHISATLQDGYGYQWWITDEGTYMALGYAGQFIFVVPEKDLVVVFTSRLEEQDFYTPQRLLEGYVIPGVQSSTPLPDNPNGTTRLKAQIQTLESSSR